VRFFKKHFGSSRIAAEVSWKLTYAIGYGPYSHYHAGFVARYLSLLEENDPSFQSFSEAKRTRVFRKVHSLFELSEMGEATPLQPNINDLVGMGHRDAGLVFGAQLYEKHVVDDPFLFATCDSSSLTSRPRVEFFRVMRRAIAIRRENDNFFAMRRNGFTSSMIENTVKLNAPNRLQVNDP
jgi:hypothetical protein